MLFKKIKNSNRLLNQSIGLILENSNDKEDIKLYYGKILINEKNAYYFTDTSEKINFSLDEADLNNAKKVTTKDKINNPVLKDCDYTIWVTVNIIDIDEPTDDMIKTNMNWK